MEGTQITYDRVRSDATTIKECAGVMQNIFNIFENSMKKVGAADVFAGDASETLGQRFARLKTRFVEYEQLVEDFSKMILSAASATEQTESKLATEANKLHN